MCNQIESFAQNVPILGHALSAIYSLRGDNENAQKTVIKASIGVITPMIIVNPIADLINQSKSNKSSRKESPKHLRQHTNWMKQYRNQRITDLWIPGSNGSGTYSIRKSNDHIFGGNWRKTQRLNITEQLNAGIRFLHLGLITKCSVKTYPPVNITQNHVYVSNVHKGDLLESFLSQIVAFVDTYNTEIVIVRIERDTQYHKQSINNEFQFLSIFKKLIGICGDRLISRHNDGMNRTHKSIKQLTHNGTKGRIVLLLQSNLKLQSDLMDSYCGWTGTYGDAKYTICYPSKWYECAMGFWCNYERDLKYWDFVIMRGQCKVTKTFIKAYITAQFGGVLKGFTRLWMKEQFDNYCDYASATNYQLNAFLQTQDFNKKKKKLIITHDYINDDIIEKIISKNNDNAIN